MYSPARRKIKGMNEVGNVVDDITWFFLRHCKRLIIEILKTFLYRISLLI